MSFERRLAAAEALQAAIAATRDGQTDPHALTDADRARILGEWVNRGWIVRTEAGWEARGNDGGPADTTDRDGRRRAIIAALLNEAEQRRDDEL
jgi:hypothetical protein